MSIGYNKPLYVRPFDKKTTRKEAVAEIARRYRAFVDDFESAKGVK